MSLFTEDFLNAINQDPVTSTIEICNLALSKIGNGVVFNTVEYAYLTEAYALLIELQAAGLLPIEYGFVDFSGELQADCKRIASQLNAIKERCTAEASRLRLKSFQAHFRTTLGSGFHYEFSQGDLERVQTLINQLRQIISETTGLEADHKARLLKRLEKLQMEVHKKVSDLDRFWGLIGDAGVVVGKLGTDAKPLVDRIREIADIVWRTQSRAEELPSGTLPPLLENKSDDSEQKA